MKKVLALVVAFALCFTAIAGCFAVSAAAPVITISSESIAAAGGNATFTISGREYTEKYAQILTVTVEAGLEVLTINDLVEYDAAKENDDEFTFDWVRSTDDKGNTVIKILNIIEADATFDYVVNVKATANTSEEADVVYDITATVEAGKYQEGVIVDVTIPAATFTVEKVAHVCDFVGDYLSDENGHWKACACGATSDVEAHVEGEAEEVEGFMVVSCTVCGYEMSKTPVEVECEHANAKFYYDETHEPVPAQGTKDGETKKGTAFFKCDDCGEIIEEELSYYYYYTTGTTNAALESEILFNFKAQKAHLEKQGAFEDAYIVLDTVKHEEDGGAIRTVTNYADADFDGTYYAVTMGIAGKEMTTAMTSTVYVKYNGKWWSGLQSNKKFVDYATNRFSKSTDIDEKTLLANMLQYGADCQRYFNGGYKLDDLATDYLGDYASLVNGEVPAITETTVNELANTPSAERSHVGYHLSSLELGSIIKIKLGFRTDFYKGEDLGAISAVCTYTDAEGNPQSKTYTQGAEVNGYDYISGYTDRYQFWYDGIAAKDMRKTVTATLTNSTGTIGYRIETSIAAVAESLRTKNASDTKLVAVINSMVNYGDAANTYFYK